MSAAPLAPTRLRAEYLVNPLGLDERQPRLSWEVQDPRRGAVQGAYQIQVAADAAALAAGDLRWDSGQVASDQDAHVRYGGDPCGAFGRYAWRVRTWDGAGVAGPWSAPAVWEMGPVDAGDWHGDWIGASPRTTNATVASPYLRKAFKVDGELLSARLVATARGSYECWLNGQRVGEDYFTPGWTEYGYRIPYQVYDVTALLQDGENAWGAILADGWFAGDLMNMKQPRRAEWGEQINFRAFLRLRYADGRTVCIATGPDWQVGEGPIRLADHYNGETYDARLERADWARPGAALSWAHAHVYEPATARLVAKRAENVRIVQELTPAAMTEPSPGAYVYDLRQNMVGWARIRVTAPAGTLITIRYAEMLQADGTLYVENLRGAKCTDHYTCRGGGEEVWEPRFTFHGFQYIELTGITAPLPLDAVTGVVLHTDMTPTGQFACSHDLVNRLQSNIQWGQRGNFLEVPTDCPQRNERLGWTGDAQVFVRTAAWNFDVAAFFTKWAQDMEDSQTKDGEGRFPDVSPNILGKGGKCAWADAGVICPWTMYLCYADTAILDRHFDSMAAWVDFMERESTGLIRPEYGYGDWLAVDAPNPGYPMTPKALIATAYFALCARLVTQAARLTGRDAAAAKYAALEEQVGAAFRREFVTPSGRLVGHTQTAYLLALGFDLVQGEQRDAAIRHLIADIEGRRYHLSTGFVGTPLLAPVLTRIGRTDIAYKLLMQDSYPSWFYPIHQGATTMWERWNSYTHEKGFGPVSMNSFNHYAYGAVGEWLYNTVAGIELDPTEPGYKHILFQPQPGGGLTWAKAELHTMHGPVAAHWQLADGQMTLTLQVPPNAHATLRLPVDSLRGVTIDGQDPAAAPGVSNPGIDDDGQAICELSAGRYTVLLPYTPPAFEPPAK